MSHGMQLVELPNRFPFRELEPALYRQWEEAGFFHATPRKDRTPYVIVIPPPNVTGALHLGHALNNTLQDILIRMKRMQGFETLWLPGTDHAGIATQAVVERRLLEEEGKTRHDLGREGLVARIWAWKDAYEKRILSQLKQMGCSCDWARTRFTLDPGCAQAVRATFFDLFQKKLIYRGKRLVNWDTMLQTAVSDDEVTHETVEGHFWHIRYPVIDPKPGEPDHVTVATTRPETMLGDTAVAVHPHPRRRLQELREELEQRRDQAGAKERTELDKQLADLERRLAEQAEALERLAAMARDGRKVRLPLLDRPLPLITDTWAKPEMGSGCVKITPAHDPNDYEVALRCDLPMINILEPDGRLNENAGPYAGLTIREGRERVVADLEAGGFLEAVEDRMIELAHSDRSKTPIEPYLADQWFVRMDQLAQSAMDAVIDGRVEIVPGRYAKTYLDWLSEKRDWPVSRQLWWGHQIPIWSRRCDDPAERQAIIGQLEAWKRDHATDVAWQIESADPRHGNAATYVHVCLRSESSDPIARKLEQEWQFVREEDVLDTWFSSALWPHSTLGWPDPTDDLAYFYPTSTLVTSRDIITLWVARMVLMGLNNVGDVPFRQVYVHPKILDAYGETMSKSKGNGVDPVDVIEKFGADALRFGLARMTTETQDIRMVVQYECPHCESLIDQTRENRQKPRIDCPKCKKTFRTQWAREEDADLPKALVVSERFEVARNFSNKLWNAARLVLMNLDGVDCRAFQPREPARLPLEDRWILSRLTAVCGDVTSALEAFRFAEAARVLYDFAWDEFCSLYLEVVKHRWRDCDEQVLAQQVAAFVLDQLLRLLHPMMPFVTEAIWQHLGERVPQRGVVRIEPVPASVVVAPWPQAERESRDEDAERMFGRFQQVLGALREIRSRQNIAPRKTLRFSIQAPDDACRELRESLPHIGRLAQAELAAMGPSIEPPAVHARRVVGPFQVFVDLEGLIDIEAERGRQKKLEAQLEKHIAGKERKLANERFVQNAPQDVVQRERAALEDLKRQLEAVREALAGLGEASD